MPELCKAIEEAIKDEAKAVGEYMEMSRKIRETERPDISIQFWSIAQDEQKHKESLEKVAKLICPTSIK